MTFVKAALFVLGLLLLSAHSDFCWASSPGRNSTHVQVTTPLLRFDYDLTGLHWSCRWKGGASLQGVSCSARIAGAALLTPADYTAHTCNAADRLMTADGLGKLQRITVHHRAEGKPELEQVFSFYAGRPWFVVQLKLIAPAVIASNEMSPIVVDPDRSPGAGLRLDAGERPRGLFVPFDNDNYVRYNSEFASDSYEVTAVYDNVSRHGFVVGSLSHDVWKTGLEMKGYGRRSLGMLRVYGGATGQWTHDSQPHGEIRGRTLASPAVMAGYFTDWRDGLETYAAAGARLQPPLAWNGPPPVGWNSWYAYRTKVDLHRTLQVADFFRDRLGPAGFDRAGSTTISFDSFWDNLKETELTEAVRHFHASGQRAGIYLTPFTFWGDDLERTVPGTGRKYTFRDIVLKDSAGAPLPKLDRGHPLDPSHPGTLLWIDWNLERFVRWGFDLVKLDFINAGALEGTHYDPTVTTGIAAYNVGMRRIVADLSPRKIGRPFFISLSIAPLFPGGYAHSRRISCDVSGGLAASGYMLNSLTYGWWAGGTLYRYNDPDMITLSADENEARTRVNSCVITGAPLLDSDDLTKPEIRERAKKQLTKPAILALPGSGRSFRPVEGDSGAGSADLFVREEAGGSLLVAVFNFDKGHGRSVSLDLSRLGLKTHTRYRVTDLWSGSKSTAQRVFPLELAAGESRILRFDP